MIVNPTIVRKHSVSEMRNSLVFTLLAVIVAVSARSPRNHPQQHSIQIRQSYRPAHFDADADWLYDFHAHRPKLTRKELLLEAIKHIVKSGRLKKHDVMKHVFHSLQRPNHLPTPPRFPQKEVLDAFLSHFKEPIKPAKPMVIDVIEQEPSVVAPDDSSVAKPIVPIIEPPALPPYPDEPVVIVPVDSTPDNPKEIEIIAPDVEPIPNEPQDIEIISQNVEPIPDQPQEIAVISPVGEPIPEPTEILLEPIEEDPTAPVPNPIEDISALIQKETDLGSPKKPSAMLLELISQLSASLGQLVGVIDQAVDKGESRD